MLSKVFSAAVWGVDAYPVEVEVNASPGKVVTVVVGLPDTAVRESCHRVINAVTNSAFRFPWGRVTFNLAPADVKKEGPSFDLPMALGIVTASEQLTLRNLHDYWVVGELALTAKSGPLKARWPSLSPPQTPEEGPHPSRCQCARGGCRCGP